MQNYQTNNPQRIAVLAAKAQAQTQGKRISPNSAVFLNYKSSLPALTDYQKSVAVGNMLGDTYLQPQGSNYRLRFEWGGINHAYAQHVYSIFQLYCLGGPREQIRKNVNGNLVKTWPFQTITHPAFNFLADVFLVNGKKCISVDRLLEYFTPVSLAFWFMDDGENVKDRNSMILHTQGFKPFEVEALAKMLADQYQLECWMKISKGLPVLMISGHSYQKFFSLVSPHIIPDMRRKFPRTTQW